MTIFFLAFILLSISATLQAQKDSSSVNLNEEDQVLEKYFNNFKDMHIGYYGTTQKCEPYDVYAFKFRWYWFLFVKKGDELSLMHVKPPIKGEKIHYPSKSFAEGIARCYAMNYTKLVKRKRNVFDMKIYGFYKFNRFGRQVIKGELLLEYPFYNKGFFSWKIDKEKAKKKAEKKAAKEAAKKVKPEKIESIKPEINNDLPVKEK